MAISSTYGTPRPASNAPGQDYEQPVGPRRQTAVGGEPQTLGPRLDVGRDLAEDQAGQGHRRPKPGVAPQADEVEQDAAEDRRVAEPVRGSSRGRRPSCSPCR